MRSAAALCAGIAALVVAGITGAQQDIPRAPSRIPSSPETKPIPRTVPPEPRRVPRQDVPRGRGWPSAGAEATENPCALDISATELQALREVILDALASDPAERNAFLEADARVPEDCTRQKALFYMRSLAVARSRG